MMKGLFQIFIVVFFSLNGLECFAQHPSFVRFGTSEGLPSLSVFDLYLDETGYLWVGTNLGLCKYESNRFKTFPKIVKSSLAASNITSQEDGTIWFQNFSGDIFKVKNGILSALVLPEMMEDIASNPYLYIYKKGFLFVSKDKSIWKYDIEKKNWHSILPDTIRNGHVFDFAMDEEGRFIVPSQDRGYIRVDIDDNTNEKLLCEECDFESSNIRYNITNLRNQVYLYEEKYVNKKLVASYIYKLEKNEFKPIPIGPFNAKINMLSFDDHNNIWVSTYAGAYAFDEQYRSILEGRSIFPNKIITDVIQDIEGSYWVSTVNSGLFMIPNLNVIRYDKEQTRLTDNRVNALASDGKDHVFLANNAGVIDKLNIQTNEVRTLNTRFGTEVISLYYHKAFDILFAGQLYLLGFRAEEQFPSLLQSASSVKDIIAYDEDEIIYTTALGTYGMVLNEFNDGDTKVFKDIPTIENKNININRDTTFCIKRGRGRKVIQDHSRPGIWLASAKGLLFIDENGEKEITFEGERIQSYALAQSDDGNIWIGTSTHGLLRYNEGELSNPIPNDQDWTINIVKQIITDGTSLWIATDQGLYRYFYEENIIQGIDEYDGLAAKEINDIEILEDKVFVATLNGMVRLPRNASFKNEDAPKVFITKVSANGEEVPYEDGFELDYDENDIRLYLSAISYKSLGAFKYKYRLMEHQKGLTEVDGSLPFLDFPAMEEGNYQVEVYAENEDGVISDIPAIWRFRIKPPFWKSWWFFMLLFTGIAILASWITRRIYQTRSEQKELMDTLQNSKLTALRAQMNPHFLFNAINSIQYFILGDEKRKANEYLGKFSDLLRKILVMSDLEFVNLEEELESLKLYLELEALRFEEDFEYTFKTDLIEVASIGIPPLILQPYIENSIKHGLLHKKKDRRLSIEFKMSSYNMLECIIDDNGVGRSRSAELNEKRNHGRRSFANQANETRLDILSKLHNSAASVQIVDKVDNGASTGTRVILKIPIKKLF